MSLEQHAKCIYFPKSNDPARINRVKLNSDADRLRGGTPGAAAGGGPLTDPPVPVTAGGAAEVGIIKPPAIASVSDASVPRMAAPLAGGAPLLVPPPRPASVALPPTAAAGAVAGTDAAAATGAAG